jgi:tRNA pseudouridine32 synthase/23S rRNA pseudouridine746 synthase/23S rRNA pseudouridine1911/1915/1917 synthase
MTQFFTVKNPLILIEALAIMSPDSSKNELKSWVEKGRVIVDGYLAKRWNTPLRHGQKVEIKPRSTIAEESLKILYKDDDIVVIDKPIALLSVRTDAQAERTVHAILKRHLKGRVWPVHRLDRDTSGVMVFALSEKARDVLKKAFFNHDIEREYYALVEGRIKMKRGTWESRLLEDKQFFVRSGPEGKLAITHFEVLGVRGKNTIVKFNLETGRKNQIRVHASEAGFPIVGDKKYGAKTSPYRRLCLHAHKLGLSHPVTGKKLTFTSPLPEELFQSL